jgi:SSS family solute:Na+ symporter
MVIFSATNLWLGKISSKKTKTEDDFYLYGRNLGLVPLILTILATQLGGGTVLGACQEAYQKGWIVLLYPLGTCLGLAVVAMGFGSKVRQMNISTISELFEKIYGSKQLRKISSLFSVTSLFIILVAQGIAARLFFASIGYSEPWVYITFWLILVAYTVMGGIGAVINTDILQVLFIIFAFFLAYFYFIGMEMSSVDYKAFSDNGDIPYIGWLLMPMLFMFIEQDMAQRFFSARSSRLVTQGAWISALSLLAITALPIYFGVKAHDSGLVVADGESVLLTAVSAFTNPTVTTFVIVAILMAIISTADTLICSISSNISYDLSIFKKHNVFVAKWITFFIGMFSLVCASFFNNVVPVLIFSYELSVSAMFVPVVIAVFGKNPSKLAATGSILCGVFSFILFQFYPVLIPREILTQLFSLMGYFGVFFLEKKTKVAAGDSF